MSKVLSVSVASYNLGTMIEDNINSFVHCKNADKVELIIVDDGSKDNTPDIIEGYAKKYPNVIKFIKKANEGPGSTVNNGIKNATGKYFRMVDGDDWVDTNNLDEFIEYLEKCDDDLVVSDYTFYDESKKANGETVTFKLPLGKTSKFADVFANVPNEMHALNFKTSIFQDNKIQLDNCFYTDVEYLIFPMRFVNTISYFNKVIYMYRIAQAGQSISPASRKKNNAQHELVLNHLMNYFEEVKSSLDAEHYYFIINRIGSMCDNQLVNYLLFDTSKAQKAVVKNFVKSLKKDHPEIYKTFKKSKKLRLLIYSHYLTYKYLAKKMQK